jgi:hypothetical protein
MRKLLLGFIVALTLVIFWPHSTVSARRRSLPGSACAGSATDTFTRGNSATLGANYSAGWTGGVGVFGITSNKASNQGSMTFGGNEWTADSFSNDQCAKMTIAHATTGGNSFHGAMVRSSGTGASHNGYGLLCDSTVIRIEKFVNTTSAPSTLGANLTGTCASGDVMMLQVTGTTLEGFKNGSSLGTRTDSAIASGSAGIYGYSTGTNTVEMSSLTVDNMSAGTTYPAAIIGLAPIRGGGR